MTIVFQILVLIIALSYLLLTFLILVFWIKGKNNHIYKLSNNESCNLKISVLIAARNESNNLINVLEDLNQQNYPNTLYEVIVIDDYSTDDTFQKAYLFSTSAKFDFKILKNDASVGKKASISKGISEAKGDWILCTDADCRLGERWIKSIVSFQKQTNADMILGGVSFYQEKSMIEHLQTIEFAALIGSGAASLEAGFPTMCNGANIAYKKSFFEMVRGYEGNDKLASGDDEFLMHKVNNIEHSIIKFNYQKESIVFTKAQENINDFTQQRKRWASKWKYYQYFYIKFIAILVFVGNINLILTPIYGFSWGMSWVKILIAIFVLKTVLDFCIVNQVLNNYGKRLKVKYFLILSMIYPFYVSFFGIISKNNSFVWKGRTWTDSRK